MTHFSLEHINVPARDPEGLARRYSNTFGLRADGNKARQTLSSSCFRWASRPRAAPSFTLACG